MARSFPWSPSKRGALSGTLFLMVITVRDGRIVHSRDYSDPIAGTRILGKLPELLAALAPGQS
jgi:hypothetical protein